MRSDSASPVQITVAIMVVLIGFVLIGLFASFGCKAYNRYQKRADAHNEVEVVKVQQEKAAEQAKVNYAQIEATKAEAEKRYQESVGIRRAQDEISSTLTPLYVQHEAIEAQKAAARSENHSEIYIPSGEQGVPLVKPVGP